jgi:hypothetical protein
MAASVQPSEAAAQLFRGVETAYPCSVDSTIPPYGTFPYPAVMAHLKGRERQRHAFVETSDKSRQMIAYR